MIQDRDTRVENDSESADIGSHDILYTPRVKADSPSIYSSDIEFPTHVGYEVYKMSE